MARFRQRPAIHGVVAVSAALLTVLALALGWWQGGAIASPGQPAAATASRAQNVDYLTSDDARALAVGINVLVPASVPAPFGGTPQIDASDGYYSLYWMIPGAPPTFLQVSGTAGGSLPAGSPANLNNQLSINASVRGADAIHDVTDIYDNVWWIEGGVLYEVSSLNMTGADSMGLADSLVSLDIPSGDTGGVETPPSDNGAGADTGGGTNAAQASVSVAGSVPSGYQATVVVGGVNNATLAASDGTFVDTGAASYEGIGSQSVQWQSPDTAQDETVTFTLIDPDNGDTLATAQIVVTGTGQPSGDTNVNQSDQQTVPPTTAPTEPPTTAPTQAQQQAQPADQTDQSVQQTSPSTDAAAQPQEPTPTPVEALRESGSAQLSDGTGGPPPPVYAGDGTGGSYVVTLPVRGHEDR